MLLWDIIRDFFVEYIFGGTTSAGVHFNPVIGTLISVDNGSLDDNWLGTTTEVFNHIGYSDTLDLYIGFADWLSTTATIIMLVLLLIMLLSLVRFVIRQVSGLFARI